jgi:hypothetical protein
MKHDIPYLDNAGLRRFGLMCAVFFSVIFGLFFPWLLKAPFPKWPWVIAAVLVPWSLVAPGSIRPFYNAWMRLSLVIGGVMNYVILGIVFFIVMTPIGFVMRIFGHDPMRRAFDRAATTYRTVSGKLSEHNMERPF